MSKKLKEYINIEEEFFITDKENKIVNINLEFDKASDIFDSSMKTKIPMLSDDFLDYLHTCFEYTPKKYKLDLNITINDLEGYSSSELENIFTKNMEIEFKRLERQALTKNKIAYILTGIGLILLIGLIIMESLWTSEGILKTIINYVVDIMTTVTIWEAMTILLVESVERRNKMKSITKRFHKINFNKKK